VSSRCNVTQVSASTTERSGTGARVDLDQRPILVFWESTKACGLACRHCRAEAQPTAAPGEFDHEASLAFLDQLAAFGRPAPVLVITGGDALT
jgi:MoaA/NifB/PqqE/SkfB family radical SAM enzyme